MFDEHAGAALQSGPNKIGGKQPAPIAIMLRASTVAAIHISRQSDFGLMFLTAGLSN